MPPKAGAAARARSERATDRCSVKEEKKTRTRRAAKSSSGESLAASSAGTPSIPDKPATLRRRGSRVEQEVDLCSTEDLTPTDSIRVNGRRSSTEPRARPSFKSKPSDEQVVEVSPTKCGIKMWLTVLCGVLVAGAAAVMRYFDPVLMQNMHRNYIAPILPESIGTVRNDTGAETVANPEVSDNMMIPIHDLFEAEESVEGDEKSVSFTPGAPLSKQPLLEMLNQNRTRVQTTAHENMETGLILNLSKTQSTNLYEHLIEISSGVASSGKALPPTKQAGSQACRWLSQPGGVKIGLADKNITPSSSGESATAFAPRDMEMGEVLMHIPRNMILSSYDALPAFTENCFLGTGLHQRKCKHFEVLMLQILYEMTLQKASSISASQCKTGGAKKKAEVSADGSVETPCAFQSCYIYSNQLNAPYFEAYEWRAVELIIPHTSSRLKGIIENVRSLVNTTFENIFRIQISCPKSKTPKAPQVFTISEAEYKQALAIVMSRSLWDVEGHVAVTPLDDLLQIHWNKANVVAHKVEENGFTWTAPRNLAQGEHLFSGQGQYNNLRLLYQHGIIVPENPWGPVWFLRRELSQEPKLLPSEHGQETISSINTEEAALQLLPEWTLKSKKLTDVPLHHSGEDNQLLTKRLTVSCDLWTFASNTYKHGSIVLSRGEKGEVGGFSAAVYTCYREMRFENIESAVEREGKAARTFQLMCLEHMSNLDMAHGRLLKGRKNAKRRILTTDLLLTAIEEERVMMNTCVSYFSKLVKSTQI